jgi:hypothetical protein
MNIKTIVLHHTASPGAGDGSLEWKAISDACQAKRRPKYPNYICDYHFGIGPTGEVFLGQQVTDPAWHCGVDAINNESLAVACIGNFEESPMGVQQEKALINLMVKLKKQYPQACVMLHKEIVATLCPGRFYPTRRVLDALSKVNQTTKKIFTDLSPENIFCHAIDEIVAKGIMNGDSEGTFRPNEFVTRGELAQVLYNWSIKV